MQKTTFFTVFLCFLTVSRQRLSVALWKNKLGVQIRFSTTFILVENSRRVTSLGISSLVHKKVKIFEKISLFGSIWTLTGLSYEFCIRGVGLPLLCVLSVWQKFFITTLVFVSIKIDSIFSAYFSSFNITDYVVF